MSRSFGWVLLLSALLKIALALVFADLPPRYDETEYVEFARAIREEGAEPRLWRAPLYQWFVAAGTAVAGGRPVGARLLQALLSVVASLLVYRIGRHQHGERAGFAAGTFVAFYPSHVAFSHLFWSETVYGFLVVLGLHRLLAADGSGRWPAAAAAGIALGLAALTRSLGIVLLASAAAWLVLGRGTRGLRLAAITVGTAAVVVVPWSLHATARAGRPVLTDLNGDFNFWSGNNEYIPYDVQGIWSVALPLENGLDPRFLQFYPDDAFRTEVPARMARAGVTDAQGPDGAAWYRREAMRELRGDPLGLVRRAPRKLATLWAPDFFLPRHLLRDWYGATPPALAAALVALTWLAAIVPLLLGPATLLAYRRTRFRALALTWVGAYLVLHGIAYGHTRMHQPLVPILVLAVSGFFFDRDDPPHRARLLRRGSGVAAIVLAGWLWIWPLLGGLYVYPGPRHVWMARVLAIGRELPLPGTERQAWMLAGVEASRGDDAGASRLLAESRHAERAWTYLMRALMAPTVPSAEELAVRALERDPDLAAAKFALARIRTTRQ